MCTHNIVFSYIQGCLQYFSVVFHDNIFITWSYKNLFNHLLFDNQSASSLDLFLSLFSLQVMSNSLLPHRLQHASLPYPSPSPGTCSNSCPYSWWCQPTISFSVISSPSPPAFSLSQHQGLFQWKELASSGQSIGVSASASVLPMNIQDWFPLGWTGLTSLQSKGLSGVFSSSTVWKHWFFGAQLSLWSNSHIHT